jgi:hypothetical protein
MIAAVDDCLRATVPPESFAVTTGDPDSHLAHLFEQVQQETAAHERGDIDDRDYLDLLLTLLGRAIVEAMLIDQQAQQRRHLRPVE